MRAHRAAPDEGGPDGVDVEVDGDDGDGGQQAAGRGGRGRGKEEPEQERGDGHGLPDRLDTGCHLLSFGRFYWY